MGDLGLEGAFGGVGMSDALNQAQNLRLKLWQLQEAQHQYNVETGQKQQGLDELHMDRLQRIQDQQQATKGESNLRNVNFLTSAVPPGTKMDPGRIAALNVPPELLKTTPAVPASLPGVTQMGGAMPLDRSQASSLATTTPGQTPAEPEGQVYTGTNAQLEQQRKDKLAETAQSDKTASAAAALDVKQQGLDASVQQHLASLKQAEDMLRMRGELNAANLLKIQAETELTRAKTEK